jgi:hypothetical protein
MQSIEQNVQHILALNIYCTLKKLKAWAFEKVAKERRFTSQPYLIE